MSNFTAIFARAAGGGGLYIGVEENFIVDQDRAPVVFFRLPDDISESDLLRELRRAQEVGEVSTLYTQNTTYTGRMSELSFLMKRDKDGVQYHPGRGLVGNRQRWAEQLGFPKPRMTEAESNAAEDMEYQEYLEDKARGGPASRFGGSDD